MKKLMIHGDEIRTKLFAWVEAVAKMVMVTMGPKWKNIIIERDFGNPIVTNDWVTVAKEIELDDKFENLWATLVKEAATKTNDQAWDGTTTTTTLTYAICKEWIKYINSWVNPFMLAKWLKKAADIIIENIYSYRNSSDREWLIEKIATLSAQDDEAGKVIADVISQVWYNWMITVEEWNTIGIEKSVTQWLQFDQWYMSSNFVTDKNRMEIVSDSFAILVTDHRVTTMSSIIKVLESLAAQGKKDILFIADDFSSDVVNTLVVNKMRWLINVVPIKAPWFSERKQWILMDIAAVTWAIYVSSQIGISLEDMIPSMTWSAKKIVITKNKTSIIWWGWSQEDIDERVAIIKKEIELSDSTYEKEKLQERLARITWWVWVIKVWAATEMEMKNRKYKIEDAINATKSAIEEWIVAWGWSVFVKIAHKLSNTTLDTVEENIALKILLSAIQYPCKIIADNAWEKWDWVVRETSVYTDELSKWFNASTWQFEFLIDSWVIDPVKVLRVWLLNSISAATMVLTTWWWIVIESWKPEDLPSERQ